MMREGVKHEYLSLFCPLVWQALPSGDLSPLGILNWNLGLDILCENKASFP